jgi:hypothetical protein
MRAIAVRFLLLTAVAAVALWPPALSHDWDACPVQSCPFWREICERGGGTFNQTEVENCVQEDNSVTIHWHGVCTGTPSSPWTMECTGI